MLSKLWQKFFVLTLLWGVFFVSSIASAGTLRVVYPANGLYSLQPKCAPNRELTVQDASVANGANVILWSINSNWHTQPSHQKWRIMRLGNSQWYKIEAENSGKALNVHNGISQNGTNVTIWPYGGRMHQYRFLDAGGGYYAIQPNINGNFVLDVNSGANADGANVHVWLWNGSSAQLWKLVARTPKAPVNPIVKPVSRPTSTVAGDANGDGRFDQADKELATDYMFGTISSLPCQKNADVNGDGKIDLSDVSLMGMRLNGLIQQFPIEEKATPTPTPQPKMAWINTQSQRLNMRAGAGQNYGIIGKLAKGTQVTVLETLSNGWSKISSSAGTGYVASRYLTYAKTGDNNGGGNVPSSVQVHLNIPLLKQNDPNWSGIKIYSKTIGEVGCTVTSLTMKYNFHNKTNIKPPDMLGKLKFEGNSVKWDSVKALGYICEIVNNRPALNQVWLSKIYTQLKNGRPVMLGAYKNNSGQHWVIVKGYSGTSTSNFSADNFQINDPQNPFTNLKQFISKYSYGLRGIVY